MAGGGGGGGINPARELDQTPTWAVAVVCAVIILISIILEKVLHMVGEWFQERKKKALFEALEKIKGELMVLGFISLLLTFGQSFITRMCIPMKFADTMLPCPIRRGSDYRGPHEKPKMGKGEHHRKLLWYERRFLAAGGAGPACKLIRGWKDWERDSIHDQEFLNDPKRFRLSHETSFVKDHASFWTRSPFSFYFVCFFRQFFRSVRKADYLTMRHGFVSVHLAPGSKFDFQKYIKRSLEDDFKVVVGISPLLWASVVFFLLINVSGWDAMAWVSILPLIVILAVGTKLQAIITQMALEITERHAVVQGIPLVQVSDNNFWFGWPQLVLYLIHFVLFQNAFEITYFLWIWYEFGLRSCFQESFTLTILRVVLGVEVQFMCSYITLPLYALVTQMGSTMKRSIFDEHTSKALKQWHKNAVKKKNDERESSPPRTLGGSPANSVVQSPQHPHQHPQNQFYGVEADRSSPKQTENIMASMDLPREQKPTKNDDFGDLLSG
ncbi:hypothetical protein CIPAW_08G076200 [Carya illinoinensis]|uniref:MLO-like protein n=1 Tax=Carya illinoinensis TaxID=32201 RepID=A0A8T1PK08_CARIL|nr:hypothetical protein CIPAW_08G076200 [Carya illinoinensis]